MKLGLQILLGTFANVSFHISVSNYGRVVRDAHSAPYQIYPIGWEASTHKGKWKPNFSGIPRRIYKPPCNRCLHLGHSCKICKRYQSMLDNLNSATNWKLVSQTCFLIFKFPTFIILNKGNIFFCSGHEYKG